MWQQEAQLKRQLATLNEELEFEKRKHMPNLGTLARLDRKIRQTQDKLKRAAAKHVEAIEAKRRKVLARKPASMDKAKKAERKVARLARKADNVRNGRPASEGLKTSKPLRKGKPLAKRGRKYAERHEAQFSEADGYGDYIRAQPCIRCGIVGRSEFAHIKGVDLGGKAEHALPLCGGIGGCHPWQEVNKKAFNEEFEERHGMHPLEMALAMRNAYLLERGSQ